MMIYLSAIPMPGRSSALPQSLHGARMQRHLFNLISRLLNMRKLSSMPCDMDPGLPGHLRSIHSRGVAQIWTGELDYQVASTTLLPGRTQAVGTSLSESQSYLFEVCGSLAAIRPGAVTSYIRMKPSEAGSPRSLNMRRKDSRDSRDDRPGALEKSEPGFFR